MKQILYTGILVLIPFLSNAQEVKLITKEEVVAKANAQNNNLKMAAQDVKAAQGDFRQTNAVLLPTRCFAYGNGNQQSFNGIWF